MGSFSFGGGPPENALDALLDELQTISKPHSEGRLDDSTSDDSSQAIQSTVTTQISQARLFTTKDGNAQPLVTNSTPTNIQQQQQQIQRVITNNSATVMLHSSVGSLRRLHSFPSGSDTDIPQNVRIVTKPPVPERTAELNSKLSGKRIPPPPPPRTSSRSPLASPTSSNVPQILPSGNDTPNGLGKIGVDNISDTSNETSSDQTQRQAVLEVRHQELLKKQKLLQEQYLRLQQMSKISAVEMSIPGTVNELKKTGSESNIQQKMGLTSITIAPIGTNKDGILALNNTAAAALTNEVDKADTVAPQKDPNEGKSSIPCGSVTTTKQLYETDIL